MDAVDLCFTPATELGRLIRARKLSPLELVEVVLARIDQLNAQLHAFLTVTSGHAPRTGPSVARAGDARRAAGTT